SSFRSPGLSSNSHPKSAASGCTGCEESAEGSFPRARSLHVARSKRWRSRRRIWAAESIYVFDAYAVIALLQAEPGATVVEEFLQEENTRCVVHVINVCEVYYDLYRRDGEEIADGVQEILEGYGFELDEEIPSSLWRAAGKLKGEWARVSLADCFALARAMREAATLVTSDHHELDRI